MFKKIAGGLLIFVGALSLFGSFFNTFSTVTLLLQILLLCSGIFLIMFDSPCKKSYAEGFKVRKTQNIIATILTVIYFAIMVIIVLGLIASPQTYVLLVYVMWAIPVIIFSVVYDTYVSLYNASKKYFLNSDEAINTYLCETASYTGYSKNDTVMANDEVIFFPKHFSLIAKNQIKSYTKVSLPIPGTRFVLTNGKKVNVYAVKYEDITTAMNSEAK